MVAVLQICPGPCATPWSPGPDFLWLFWEILPDDCTNQLQWGFIRPDGEGFALQEQRARSGCSLHCAALALVDCHWWLEPGEDSLRVDGEKVALAFRSAAFQSRFCFLHTG